MSGVTWGDDSTRIRLFRTAARVSAHFYEAVALGATGQADPSTDHVEGLNDRWLLLKGEQTVVQYEQALQKDLLPLEGQWPFDHIRRELAKPFAHDRRLSDVNKQALEQVRECLKSWGGRRAKKRGEQLKVLPLHFESTDADEMQFFFERSAERILGRAGAQKCLLRECMILQFSLFHEYLSHAFPTWSKDVEPVSEGLLLALEFDWFESEYTPLDNELLRKVWHDRFGQDRRSFWMGRWLLNHCRSRDCVRRFLLEWVAGWESFEEDENLDLLSQLQGVYNKTGHKLGGQLSAKQKKTKALFDSLLCHHCDGTEQDIRDMKKELTAILSVYGRSK